MTNDPIRQQFPRLCELLAGSPLDGDLDAAVDFAAEGEPSLRAALEGGIFHQSELLWLLASALTPHLPRHEAESLEGDLSAVIEAVGVGPARGAYRDKLLVNERDKLEDVRYELAVSARACAALDPGSVILEKPISDPSKDKRDWKNTDVFGTFNGQPVRIESTVLHETLPPAVSLDLDEIVRGADVTSTFRLVLKLPLRNDANALRVRALVELLHESHLRTGGADEEIDGIRFAWRRGAYHCDQATSPIDSISYMTDAEFVEARSLACDSTDDRREVVHAVSTRNLTPEYIREDYPNPPGVVTLADLPDSPRNQPVSTKIHQMLSRKLLQCETGVINIIAFGTPYPMNDRDVEDAVRGVGLAMIARSRDDRGVYHAGEARFWREPRAPFVPAHLLPSELDRRQFIEPFRRMSAVWQVRLGPYALSRVFANPNSTIPVSDELVTQFGGHAAGLLRQPPGEPTFDTEASQTPPEAASPADDDETIWHEMAVGLVMACGSVAEARRVVEALRNSGRSLDELRTEFEGPPAGRGPKTSGMTFLSPTNEELAIELILGCGGYEKALDALGLLAP